MARPFKPGLQYFPLDVSFFEDEKVQDLNLDFGILGEVVYLRLLTMIYAEGYYLTMSVPDLAKYLMRVIGTGWVPSKQEMEEVIYCIGKVGLLDIELMKQGILTSRGIQKQFILSTKRRKTVNMSEHCLLTEDEIKETRKLMMTF